MENLLYDTGNMLTIVVAACILVLFAMLIDLASGLYKAKQRGEVRSSYGLKRSVGKFIMYEGSMLIAAGVDLLIHYCRLFKLLHLDVVYGLPLITCLIGIFLLAVEFLSVREKADEKTRLELSRAEQLAAKMLNKEELVDALTKAIVNATKQKGGEYENTD